MAVLQMQRINIYALKKDRKPILEMLQRRGVVEIKDISKEDKVFHKTDTSNAKSIFEKNISTARDAVELLNRYAPEKKSMLSSLNGRKSVSVEDYASFKDKYGKTVDTANRILSYNKAIAEYKAEIHKLDTQAEILVPWTNLDIPISFSGTKYTKSFIGTLPREWTLEVIYEKLSDFMPLTVDVISASKEQTCIFVLCTRDKADQVYDALRAIEFAYPGLTSDKAPTQQLIELDGKIAEAYAAIDQAEKEIMNLVIAREDLLFLQDYDRMRADKYEAISQLKQSKNIFILSGYIPVKDAKQLEEELNSSFTLAVELNNPSKKEDVPVLLQNNGFAKPLEGVLLGFSYPAKGEVDPTFVMALFYYLLYGIMLSDAGYGLLMVIGCAYGLIRFRKTMEESTRNTLRMFLYCGISTVFWGAMFGSFFGDLIDVIANTFFGVEKLPIIPPLWFSQSVKPMKMLTFSMALGLVHLLTGLIMKLYQLLKAKDYKAILYDVVTWFFLVVCSTVLLISMDMVKNILGVNVTIPPIVVRVSGIIAIIASVGIVLTNGRESRNPFKRFLKGLYALYGISGYLSDVLSYSRLLALGLATGIIGSVINKMAAMPGGVLKPIVFTIIVIAGHALNIGINALGSYVHTNRLQYVEFFGKFYEGGGRAFNPFNMNTKYYKIKEKM